MAKKPMPGDYESMTGGVDPEISSYVYKKMMGLPVTDKEMKDVGDQPIPLPRPKPQMVNRAKKGNKLPVVAKKNGGKIDGVAMKGRTRGKMC